MVAYRIYYLDENDRVRHRVELDCDDDEAALALMERHADGGPMELWDRARLVKKQGRK